MRLAIVLVALVVMAQVIVAQPTVLAPTQSPDAANAAKGATILTANGAAPANSACTGTSCKQTTTPAPVAAAPCCCHQQVAGCNVCGVSSCPAVETVQPEIIQKVTCNAPCGMKDNKCSCPEHVQPEIRTNSCPCAGTTPCGCSGSSIIGATVVPETKAPHVTPELKEPSVKTTCGCAFTKVSPCPCAAFLELPSNN